MVLVLLCIPSTETFGSGSPPDYTPEIPEWLTPGYTSGMTPEKAAEYRSYLPPGQPQGPSREEIEKIRRGMFSTPIDGLAVVPSELEVFSVAYDGPTQAQRIALTQSVEASLLADFASVAGHYIVSFHREAFPYILKGETRRDHERVDTEGYTVRARATEMVQSVDGELHSVWNYSFPGFSAWLSEPGVEQIADHPMVKHIDSNIAVPWDVDQDQPISWGLRRIHNENFPSEDVYRYFFSWDGVL